MINLNSQDINYYSEINPNPIDSLYKNDDIASNHYSKAFYRKPREFLENNKVEINEKSKIEFNSYTKSFPISRCENEDGHKTSNAAINAIKGAQIKNNRLNDDNERLRIELSNFQTELLYKEKAYVETLNQISLYEYEKNELVNQLRSLSKNNELMNSLLKLVEKEKKKHLVQSAIEKEQLNKTIKSLSNELENLKKLFGNLSKENKNQREEISKNKEIILINETKIKNLKNEISELNENLSKKDEECDGQKNQLKANYEQERESLLMKIHALQEIIVSSSKDDKKNKSSNDKKIREIKKEMSTNKKINYKTSNNFLSKESQNTNPNKNIKNNNTNNFKTKIFTNKKYTGNEAKSLFKYLLRSKSMDKNSFLDNSIPKPKKTVESLKNERVSTPFKSKLSESLSINKEKEMREADNDSKPLKELININEKFDLLNKSLDIENFQEKNDLDSIIDSELIKINSIIFNLERKTVELNRKSQNIKIMYNAASSQEEQLKLLKEINDIDTEIAEDDIKLRQLKIRQKDIIEKSLK